MFGSQLPSPITQSFCHFFPLSLLNYYIVAYYAKHCSWCFLPSWAGIVQSIYVTQHRLHANFHNCTLHSSLNNSKLSIRVQLGMSHLVTESLPIPDQGRTMVAGTHVHSNSYWQKLCSFVQICLRHSLWLNADVAARAWVFLDSWIVGGKFILQSLIHD